MPLTSRTPDPEADGFGGGPDAAARATPPAATASVGRFGASVDGWRDVQIKPELAMNRFAFRRWDGVDALEGRRNDIIAPPQLKFQLVPIAARGIDASAVPPPMEPPSATAPVGVLLDNGPAWVIVDLALVLAQRPSVPILPPPAVSPNSTSAPNCAKFLAAPCATRCTKTPPNLTASPC